MDIPKTANVNWVDKVSLYQEFAPVDSIWFPTKDKFIATFSAYNSNKLPGMIGRKTTTYHNVRLNDTSIEKVGGLDKDLYAHMEEVDVCWRLKNAGYKIGYIGKSLVYHVGGSVISYGSPAKLYYNFRNNLILLIKNEKTSKLLWLFPFRLMLDGVAGLRLLLTGEYKQTGTILKAHFHFYRDLGKWLQRRRENKQLIALSSSKGRNEEGIYRRSIVWDYFLLRRKKFSELGRLLQSVRAPLPAQ